MKDGLDYSQWTLLLKFGDIDHKWTGHAVIVDKGESDANLLSGCKVVFLGIVSRAHFN